LTSSSPGAPNQTGSDAVSLRGQTTGETPPGTTNSSNGADLAAAVRESDVRALAYFAAEHVCGSPDAILASFDRSPFKQMEDPLQQRGIITGGPADSVAVASEDGWRCMAGYCGIDNQDHPNEEEVGVAYATSESALKEQCIQNESCRAYQINNVTDNTTWKGWMKTTSNAAYGTNAQKQVAKCCVKPSPVASGSGSAALLDTGTASRNASSLQHKARQQDRQRMKAFFNNLSPDQKGLFLEAVTLRLAAAIQPRIVQRCNEALSNRTVGTATGTR